MTSDETRARFRLLELSTVDPVKEFSRDVATGLQSTPKRLACRYFYDREGSHLFEKICALPEYYLTRTETAILHEHVNDIVSDFKRDVTVVELGSGGAIKTQILLKALLESQRRVRYVPIDICRPVLEESAAVLLKIFPALEIVAVHGEYHDGLRFLEAESDQPKLILWLGSNIGNFERNEAASFLRRVSQTMKSADRVLIGVDLRKDRTVLEAAYDDAAGITAKFNLNLLARINRELEGDFELASFQHRAIYDVDRGRIEMYLVSRRSQEVMIGRLGLRISFTAGEMIHTENSYKYSLAEINSVVQAAGLQTDKCWQDAPEWFSVHLLKVMD